jgi:competence protein ComEC
MSMAWPERRMRAADRLALWAERAGPRLALWLPVAMIAGVVACFQPRAEPPAWLPWLLVMPLPLAMLAARRSLAAAWGLALLGAGGLGFALAAWHAALAPPPLEPPRGAATVTGLVVEVDPLPGEALRLTLRGASWAEGMAPARRDIRVRLRDGDAARPLPSDTVRLRALIRPPSPPAFPGAWDFQRSAYFSGLGGSGFALGPVEIVARGGRAPPLAGMRAVVERRVMEAVPGPAGAIAAALLSGGQSGIAPAEMQAMRDSGLAHLLSVSGLHIAIVMGVTFFVVRFGVALVPALALRVESKPVAAVAALAAGGFYMVLTGSQVPMLRSFAMACLVTLGLLAGRRALTLRVLAFAAVCVIAIQPEAVMGPSFQMSFGAVMALVAAHEATRGRWPAPEGWWGRAALVLGATVATSVVAGLATAPAGLHHFGRLQLYGVAANALAVPLTSFVVMPAGMLALSVIPLGLEALPLAVMGWGVDAILWVARVVAAWPGAALSVAPIPGWGMAVTALGLCWLCLVRGGWRWLSVPAVAAGLASGAAVAPPLALASADGRLFALVVDGQPFLERRPGAQRFLQEQWLRGFGEEDAPTLPREGEAAGGRIACTPELCLLRDTAGAPLVALWRPPPPRRNAPRSDPPPGPHPACGAAPVLLSPEPVRGRCAESRVVDRFSLWRDGAHAVLAGGTVVSDRAHRGERRWVPPRPLPRATATEPPAETE